jgi:hypothetical protein
MYKGNIAPEKTVIILKSTGFIHVGLMQNQIKELVKMVINVKTAGNYTQHLVLKMNNQL